MEDTEGIHIVLGTSLENQRPIERIGVAYTLFNCLAVITSDHAVWCVVTNVCRLGSCQEGSTQVDVRDAYSLSVASGIPCTGSERRHRSLRF